MVAAVSMNQQSSTKYISGKQIKKKWLLVDVDGLYVGRVASVLVNILRGKNKPYYTPFLDCGDNLVVVNCSKLKFTGDKMNSKSYLRHTGYPGGQRFSYVRDLIKECPSCILLRSIKGMLPKNRLGRKLLKNVRCFDGGEHNLGSQNPERIELK